MDSELQALLDQMKADAASWVTKMNTAGDYVGANYMQGLLQHIDLTGRKIEATSQQQQP